MSGRVDFRCVRFPGLISAMTTPSGGTSDYAPEMIHAAAKGEPYACFVRQDTRIPFITMPDGVDALLTLASAPRERLQRSSYNVGAFNPSAAEIHAVVIARLPRRRPIYPGRPTSSVRRSSIPGPPTSTTRRRAATGASRRPAMVERAFGKYARFRPYADATPSAPQESHSRHMPTITVEGFAPVEVEEGKRLVLAIEQDVKVDILHACGGNARCTTCTASSSSKKGNRRR